MLGWDGGRRINRTCGAVEAVLGARRRAKVSEQQTVSRRSGDDRLGRVCAMEARAQRVSMSIKGNVNSVDVLGLRAPTVLLFYLAIGC